MPMYLLTGEGDMVVLSVRAKNISRTKVIFFNFKQSVNINLTTSFV